MREDVREMWGWGWLERLWLDTRLAVRLWARTHGFTAIAWLRSRPARFLRARPRR